MKREFVMTVEAAILAPVMDPEVKAAWLAGLRGGEYRQGKGQLRSADGLHCCLGVLCDLHRKATGEGEWQETGSLTILGDLEYLGTSACLPTVVAEWAGLGARDPKVTVPGSGPDYLSNRNDQGCSFAEIADLIEAQL